MINDCQQVQAEISIVQFIFAALLGLTLTSATVTGGGSARN